MSGSTDMGFWASVRLTWSLQRLMAKNKTTALKIFAGLFVVFVALLWIFLLMVSAILLSFGGEQLRAVQNDATTTVMSGAGYEVPEQALKNPHPTLPILDNVYRVIVERMAKEREEKKQKAALNARGIEQMPTDTEATSSGDDSAPEEKSGDLYANLIYTYGDASWYFSIPEAQTRWFRLIRRNNTPLVVYATDKDKLAPEVVRYIEDGLGAVQPMKLDVYLQDPELKKTPSVLLLYDKTSTATQQKFYQVSNQGLTYTHELATYQRRALGQLIGAVGVEQYNTAKAAHDKTFEGENIPRTIVEEQRLMLAPSVDPRMVIFLFMMGGAFFIGTVMSGPMALEWEQKRARHVFEPYALMRAPIGVILGKEILNTWIEGAKILTLLFGGVFVLTASAWGAYGTALLVIGWCLASAFLWFELTLNLFLVAAFQSRVGRIMGRILILPALLVPLWVVRSGLSYYWYRVTQGMPLEDVSVLIMAVALTLVVAGAAVMFRLTVWRIGRYNTGLVPLR